MGRPGHSGLPLFYSPRRRRVYLTSLDLLCVRCARLGTTCCQGTEIHVTRGDVRRITLETAKIWHRILIEEILHDGNHHRLDLRPAL